LGFQTFKVQGLSGWQARTSKSKRHMKNGCLTTPQLLLQIPHPALHSLPRGERDCIYYYLASRLKVAALEQNDKRL